MDNDTSDNIDDFTRYVMSTFKKDSTSIDIRPESLTRLSQYEYLLLVGVLDLINFPNLKEINCSGNKITKIINIPYLRCLTCSSNMITELNYLPDTLEYLDCSHNYIVNLDDLPSSLRHLNCSYCYVINLNSLPNKLRILKCDNNKTYIYYLPPKLEMLKCGSITELKDIPDSLNEIYIFSDIQLNCEKTHKQFYENFKKIRNGYYRRIKNSN